ncbi:MAG: peptidase M16 [Pseudomonadales bacterium]|nr:peptidase M16 [Pseudomonadales bacterium]
MTDVSSAEPTQNSSVYKPDQFHPAFEWLESEHIPSLNIVMDKYVHRETGALHYHLASDNTENVFLVAFRTVPMDSTGVAHILEHTALCGSERFPVRDPFFMMIRRSLQTFMNAFTSSDWTAYPFASKNKKDFNNLLNVYLDATFFSRLDELDFSQEGHRLEFAEMEDADSELQYKGVVFNEMKGAMSSTNSVLWQTMSKYLYPTTTYHYNSGGEPDDIPNLSYQQLKSFYQSHYHPSNSVFMTFGNIPAHEHQTQFEDLALSKFEKLDVNIEVGDEQRYSEPLRFEEPYAADNDEANKSHIVMGWLLGYSTDLSEVFKAQLLSSVLLDNSASPLLKALETSDLGSAPSPMCGLEDSSREMSFMAGLEGCNSDNTTDIEELIVSTLEEVVNNGIPMDQVEAALHQLELNQREISGDSYPYGLQLILMGLSTALHRGDPISLLNIDPVLDELREAIKDSSFIPALIKEFLLNNPHRITLTLIPDPNLAMEKVEAEKARLTDIKTALTPDQISQIISRSKALAERQMQEDDPGLLPKVGLSDVPSTLLEPSCTQHQLSNSNLECNYFGQGTNGLSYQQIVIDLPQIDSSLLEVLPLYTSCLPELGVGSKDYAEVQVWQSQISGGINCFSSIRSELSYEQAVSGYVSFSSKSLSANHKELTELLRQTLTEVRFDESQRLTELIEQICARKENSITGHGHSLAMNLACSKMNPTANLAHNFGGLAGIRQLKQLRDGLSDPNTCTSLLSKFKELHQIVLSADKRLLSIDEEASREKILNDIDGSWDSNLSTGNFEKLELASIREQVTEAWTTATQVNFCAKAYPTVPSSHTDNATLHVLAGYLRNGFLHRAIREQGGAYGGGASQDANSASFRFFSYRDPRLEESLNDFDASIQWLLNEKQPEHQLEEAILGVIATMDKPSSPAGEAKQAFYNRLFGRSLEHRMAFRQRVLSTTLNDLRAVAERYFDKETASIGIITNREATDTLNSMGLSIENI